MCSKSFDKPVQLGGHISKFHSGKSESYNAKMLVRKRNEFDRECLKEAKDWFAENTECDIKKNRDLVTKIKKLIKDGIKPKIEDFERKLKH